MGKTSYAGGEKRELILFLSIAAMLIAIGVKEETAYADACKLEHDLSDETFECIKKHYVQHYKN